MIYEGKFKDINNKDFRVEIITNADSTQEKEIILNEDPVVVSYNGGDDTIYSPAKYSSATINIISNEPYYDMYTFEAKEVKVEIKRDKDIVWIGYLEPMVFNQDWESDIDQMEITCLDGLSILQYLDYKTDEKKLITFPQLIIKILRQCDCYRYFYIPTTLTINDDKKTITKLKVSENNFFDEDGKPMTCQEVLEEVTKYLGFTVVAYGDNVFFLDYDAIKQGHNEYLEFNLGSGTSSNHFVNLQDMKTVESIDYSSSGNQISLAPVYNKATVKSDLYPIDNFIPGIWDNVTVANTSGNLVDEVWTPTSDAHKKHVGYFQFVNSEDYITYSYPIMGGVGQDSRPQWNTPQSKMQYSYEDLKNNVGAVLCKHSCFPFVNGKYEPNKLNLEKYLLIYAHNYTAPVDTPAIKLFSRNTNTNVVAGADTYLIIKGSLIIEDAIDLNAGKSEIILDKDHKQDNKAVPNNCYLTMELKIGEKYYSGDENGWVRNRRTFNLEFEKNKDGDYIGQTLSIKSNITWQDNLNANGYKIKIPVYDFYTEPELTIYIPSHRISDKHWQTAIWLKDFEIGIEVANSDKSEGKESSEQTDTKYTNVVNENSVKELDEINFKVCTYDNKTPNYSSVSIGNTLDNKLVDKVKHLYDFGRQEENLISKIVRQYKTPTIVLDLNLKDNYKPYSLIQVNGMDAKKFIIDSYEINYEKDSTLVHLVEKK